MKKMTIEEEIHEIRAKIAEKTLKMTTEEKIAFFNEAGDRVLKLMEELKKNGVKAVY